jgi:hypothetical protein
MSAGFPCTCSTVNPWVAWTVTTLRANYSAFNGGRRTPSAYSQVMCTVCRASWRTKAAYVDDLRRSPGA